MCTVVDFACFEIEPARSSGRLRHFIFLLSVQKMSIYNLTQRLGGSAGDRPLVDFAPTRSLTVVVA